MKVKHLTLRNFRKFNSQSFVFHPRFNALIGRNATGKTQILDALAIILNVYQTKFTSKTLGITNDQVHVAYNRYAFNNVSDQYRNEPLYPVEISANIQYNEQTFEQTCTKASIKGRTTIGGVSQLSQIGKRDKQYSDEGRYFTLPCLAYYGSGRLLSLRRHVRNSKEKLESRADGYADSLDPRNDVVGLQEWLRRRELICLQKKMTDAPLELVRLAAAAMIPDCKTVYFDFETGGVYLEFNDGSSCPFYNLSDGFRCMIALTVDLARRIALLNPHLGTNALSETSGIVMIDELDLYLHPEWQRRVVDDLKNVFPKIQFITTTHSPFIIQSLQPGEVLDLEACDGQGFENNLLSDKESILDPTLEVAQPGPVQEYARRSLEDITENIMGIPVPQRSQRYQEMYETAIKYYRILEKGENASLEEKERLKDKLNELEEPFSEDVAYSAFLKMERLARGLQ